MKRIRLAVASAALAALAATAACGSSDNSNDSSSSDTSSAASASSGAPSSGASSSSAAGSGAPSSGSASSSAAPTSASSSAAPTSASSSAAPTRASSSAVPADAADKLLKDAQAALAAARSVHINGQLIQGGQKVGLDVDAFGGTAIRGGGTITTGGIPQQIRLLGTAVYLKAPAKYWINNGAGSAQAGKLAAKWVKLPVSASRGVTASYGQLVNTAKFAKLTLGSAFVFNIEPTKGKPIGGRGTVVLADGKGNSYTFAGDNKQPLSLSERAQGTITFSKYNMVAPVTAPPAGQVLKLPGS